MSAIAAIATILSSVLSTAANYKISQQQKEYNERMQDKMNDYNLPINQVQRLKDAGINPNQVAMGNSGVVTGNTSSSLNPYQTPSLADPLALASNSFLSYARGSTENQLREVRKQEAEANVQLMFANAQKLGVDSQYQSILNAFAAFKESAAITESRQRSRLYGAERAKFMSEAKKFNFEVEKILPQELKNMIAEENLSYWEVDQIIARIANYNADTSLKGAQQENVEADTSLTPQRQAEMASQTYKNASEAAGQEITNSNAQSMADAYLAEVAATVNKLKSETAKTDEEVYWYVFDLLNKTLPSRGLDSKIARYGMAEGIIFGDKARGSKYGRNANRNDY